MVKLAEANFPAISFSCDKSLIRSSQFDLVFSSFVLFELSNKEKIVQYLQQAAYALKDGGMFIGVTGSESLYSPLRNWMTFDARFPENKNIQKGSVVKLLLRQSSLEFYDYYWEADDYIECFNLAGFRVLKILSPLGLSQEPYAWQDELIDSPFTIFVAQKK
jgi:hypothetical protein